ncbi:FimV/HubP family polar landmark protein [Shewanella pneumatophori]|uniref:Pilus assembly protein FimV n=1 Tax=Shewanella pneumatophori TaxID=314092 RepID=A0A9X1ZG44_9GAMM|nr:FimV/HubP family polar landmark protein [Shewanella pneumatophori]MCL1139245.1 pilus assembly protein FimV [Shewanella pneumatophori]
MNFRTSYLVGLIATGIVAIAAPSIHSATAAEPLKITGPDGQVKSNIQTNAQVNQSDPQGVRQYGPTTSADTFWSIAQAVKPDNSVTVYQVMSALFDANPHAFSSKNYNSLERGMILLVPSKSVMQQTPAADAKARAENNDQRWSSSSVVTQPSTPAKAAPKPVIAANTVSPNSSSKSNPLIAELSEEVKSLTAQVESIQAKNLELTDELARASDEIVVGSSDTAAFQDEISQLKQENALLKQALQEAKAETAALEQEIQVSQQQMAKATESQNEPTSNLWRTIMDNPLLLVLGAVLPAIIVIGIFWLFLRRKKEPVAQDSTAEQQVENSASDADKPVNNAEPTADDADDMAVHLDTDSGADDLPLKEIAAVGAAGIAAGAVAHEQDIVVEDSQDDGQSLDDLWAEAMGEQDQADSLDGFDTNSSTDDDLDSLLAGFDEPETQAQDSVIGDDEVNTDDDLDALLAGFDEPEAQAQDTVTGGDAVNSDNDDLDALLAGFDEPETQAQDTVTGDDAVNTDDDDLDALLAGFDEPEAQAQDTVTGDDAVNSDDDLDSLFAGFDEPETQAQDTVTGDDAVNTDDDDLDALLVGFDEPEAQAQDTVTDDDAVNTDDELEALLASLENDSNDAGSQQDIDSLSDEMAAELALGFEIAAELEDEDSTEQQKLDSELDSEIDALLAEFDMPSDSDSPEITGGLEHTDTAEETTKFDPNESDDLELATTENTLEPVTELVPELEPETETETETETQSFTAEASDSDLSSDVESIDFDNINFSSADQDSETVDSDKHGSENEQDFLTRELQEAAAQQEQVELAKQADIDAFLAPKTEFESTEASQVSEKESGFFDDLKADNQTTDNSLDWESISAPLSTSTDNEIGLVNDDSFKEKENNLEALNSDFDLDIAAATELTDEELLSNLAQAGDVEDSSLDLSDDSFTLDSDSKMTVDEALAALDAEEYVEHKPSDEATEQQDLSNFQRDNGFIDIDMLLSEADEDNGETDLYKQFDVDMGELNSLMGNSSMVDVDDEENSVNAKLDLARAYIEIDDNDSARALLKEVELDGNDRQQAEAVGLLKELV